MPFSLYLEDSVGFFFFFLFLAGHFDFVGARLLDSQDACMWAAPYSSRERSGGVAIAITAKY